MLHFTKQKTTEHLVGFMVVLSAPTSPRVKSRGLSITSTFKPYESGNVGTDLHRVISFLNHMKQLYTSGLTLKPK